MESEVNETESLSAPQKPHSSRVFPRNTRLYFVGWLIDHLKDPFPDKVEKANMAKTTNLTVKQVSNWMINARRRILPLLTDEKSGLNSKSTAAEVLDYSDKVKKLKHQQKRKVATKGQKSKKSKRISKNRRKKKNKKNVQGKKRKLSKPGKKHLMSWLEANVENPYPGIDAKKEFMCKTNLHMNQVNNWLMNARKRIIPKLNKVELVPENAQQNVESHENNTVSEENSWVEATDYLAEPELLFDTDLPFESVAMVEEVVPSEEEASDSAIKSTNFPSN